MKEKTLFFCQSCGYESPKWLGRCPACGEWNRFVEERGTRSDSGYPRYSGPGKDDGPVPIDRIEADDGERILTGIAEMDRVLGGGIVPGSSVLVGGDPGIGKSTLMLQVVESLARRGNRGLYISGEESARQIKLRGSRVGASSENLLVYVEIALEKILREIRSAAPHVVVVDSIQTLYSADLASAPGSVGQVRESSEQLILLAKKTGIPVFLIGHVTKDGSIAGPRVLEHMVDAVLYFQGESGHPFRIVRSVKNRYGPSNEIGVFEMGERGLTEVANPSALFLTERPEGAPGSVVVPSMEGTRPILVEIQALTSETQFGMPRRTTIGVDHNRVSLLAAVMDRIGGFNLNNHDIYMNVAGGVRLNEPAVDVGIVSSLLSSFLNRPIDRRTVVCGEVGLTGEIRGIGRIDARVRESSKMGFARILLPRSVPGENLSREGLDLVPIAHVRDLMDALF
ncbi:MAG TPA: DNA repair protein RadA [Syntrophales bacterium]|nr:DNA repair protein RadA [Syntrophales bacterium]